VSTTVLSAAINIIKKRHVIGIFLSIVVILFGYSIVPNFGLSLDEPVNRNNATVTLNYLVDIAERQLGLPVSSTTTNKSSNLLAYKDRDYGASVDLLFLVFEDLLRIEDLHSKYIFRHYCIHTLFLLGLLAFYSTLSVSLRGNSYGVLGVLLIILSPRIYADTFYNVKDAGFMSLFMCSIWSITRICQENRFRYIILFSFFAGVAINIRIVGLILIPILVFILFWKYRGIRLTGRLFGFHAVAATFGALVVTVLLWPWLWEAPVDNLLTAIRNMAYFRWDGWILFRGTYYSAGSVPRMYLPVWIFITVPIFVLTLFCIGLLFTFRLFIWARTPELKRSIYSPILIVHVVLIIFMISYVVIMRPILYDGWRQFYFLYPSIIYLAILGWKSLWEGLRHNSMRFALSILMTLHIAITLQWMSVNFPLWNVYFNALARDVQIRYEKDYWGLSVNLGLTYLAEQVGNQTVTIAAYSHVPLQENLAVLPKKFRNKLIMTNDINSADFIIFNYRIFQPFELTEFMELQRHKKIFYEIKVDDFTVLTILSN
jgi:hypothetical protein